MADQSTAGATGGPPPSPDLLRFLVEHSSNGVCITDELGLFEYVNPTYGAIYGYAPEELLGRHFTLVVPLERHELLREMHDRFIAGETEMPGEFEVQARDGRRLVVSVRAALLVGQDGKPRKVTYVNDVTALREQNERLAALLTERARFLRTMAHDLRNPLVAIGGMAGILAEEGADCGDDIPYMASRVVSNVQTMEALLDRLGRGAGAEV